MQKTTFPVELIIHDDASTDSTTDIIRDYESKYPHIIKPIYQEENQYSKGIKIGVKYIHPQIKGKYYAICEGDDYWIDPLKLQKQVDILEGNDEVGIVHTGFIKYDMINNVKTEQRVKVIGEPLDYYLNSWRRSEEHTSELQSRGHLVCRLLLEKKNNMKSHTYLEYHVL